MLNMNRVTLVGNVGRKPEMRTLQSGASVASFSLATTERWRDKDGEARESTEWQRIVAFGHAAETAQKLVAKDDAVLVEGRVGYREYKDEAEIERKVTEIVVSGPGGVINVLSSKKTGQETAGHEGGGDAA